MLLFERPPDRPPKPYSALLVSDLDGTLLDRDGAAHPRALAALRGLGDRGVLRVIATGRSLASFQRVSFPLPIDCLVFSSGAGVLQLGGEPTLLRRAALSAAQVETAAALLQSLDLDYMIHPPVPEEHAFSYRSSTASRAANPDFWRRVALYRQSCRPLDPHDARSPSGPATQLLAITGAERGVAVWTQLRAALPELNVVRTTSPLDGSSTWLEIFAADVSKSRACSWLATAFGLEAHQAVCVGNDYNDTDLLAWGGTAFVTADAPTELRARHPTVAPPAEGGIADLISRCFPPG